MLIKYYEGESIYLRPLEIADEPVLRKWVNDPSNWRTLARCFPINEFREKEYIENLYKSQESCSLGLVLRDGDQLIGATGLDQMSPINRSATFGLLIGDEAHKSRGYGSEAVRLMLRLGFAEFNLNRIELIVFAEHQRAIRAYERAGFLLEGRAREVFFRGGRYHDVLRYAILRGDWEREPDVSDDAGCVDQDFVPASLAV